MKRILIIFCILFYIFLLPLSYKTVNANGKTYYRILKENAYIYADVNLTSPMFIIPYTYYVKAENVSGTTARVVYGDENSDYPVIIGYMPLTDLTLSDITPINPYAVIKVSTNVSDILFNDVNKKKAYFNIPSETFMIYYGEIKDSNFNTLCMVYCKNKLGYIDKTSLNSFKIEQNSDPLPSIKEEPTTPSDGGNLLAPSSALGENLQIVIIVGISTICISVVYALFRPTKNKTTKQNEYFEEG